ncbi:MAG: hypothetical protein ACQEXE_04960 [Bacillota bacterium]
MNHLMQFENIINAISNCYTTPNKSGFTINNKLGVQWGKTNRKKKWGQAFQDSNRFLCALDILIDSNEIEDLSQKISLPIRNEGEEISGIRKITCPGYDTIQISLYRDINGRNYCFNNDLFISWIQEVARENQR